MCYQARQHLQCVFFMLCIAVGMTFSAIGEFSSHGLGVSYLEYHDLNVSHVHEHTSEQHPHHDASNHSHELGSTDHFVVMSLLPAVSPLFELVDANLPEPFPIYIDKPPKSV